jgi:hypothetical protein
MSDYTTLGALWKVTDPKSEKSPRLRGVLKIDGKDVRVAVFVNDRKRPGKQDPDYNIVESKDMKGTKAPEKKVAKFDDL